MKCKTDVELYLEMKNHVLQSNKCGCIVEFFILSLDVLMAMYLSNDEPTQEYAVEALSELITIQSIQVCLGYRISSLIRRCFFSFQNNPKNLDPSYKTDLDLWDCLGRVKPVLQQN